MDRLEVDRLEVDRVWTQEQPQHNNAKLCPASVAHSVAEVLDDAVPGSSATHIRTTKLLDALDMLQGFLEFLQNLKNPTEFVKFL